ncbi:beta-propeller domain-containing protein [Myxococcus landrumensis]|uniref:Beta-propeller domain-containing protein n=1 Tax=Myxococcus landrumensis TaxID=2813577 RepID=A0ABX7N131_9BACT|nr:beta-propeller domain-containing protein [Myxococcus landrumus]QSQ12419.1 beta-propeller domain-containing protein [Myxococcus landrumus]
MRQWKRYGWVGLAAVAAVGCGDEKQPWWTENEPVRQEARLDAFASCESLESFIEDTATKRMRAMMEASRPRGWWMGDGVPSMPNMGEEPENDGSGAPREPDDYTGTNNQVTGVHEADFVQNDGTNLFVLSGSRLYVHRSWPAEQLTLSATMDIEGWPREMLYDKERRRLVITSQVDDGRPGRPSVWHGGRGGMMVADCAGFNCGVQASDTLKVTVVDVTNLAAPQVARQLYLPGSYLSARRVDGAVRLVLSDDFRWPDDVRFYPEYSRELFEDRDRLDEAIDALIAKNEKLIRAQSLDNWIPSGRSVAADGKMTPLRRACSDFYRPNASSGLGFVTVVSLDLDAPGEGTPPGHTSVVSAPGDVYASAQSLYLAVNHWWWSQPANESDHTYLHKFDIREPGRATYVGSGSVQGSLVNQFAMDEYEGVLRVATTVTTQRSLGSGNTSGPPGGGANTVSRVVTLAEQGGGLKELGRSEDLAPGERIFSARFVGKRGYVVTFLQKDPLFTFDLSDPVHPRKVGALNIPGFSTYIHPLGDTHLLTFGEDRDLNGDWSSRALKVSLFDVSDLSAPKEAFTHRVGTLSSYSEALYEHKAFNFFPAKGLLAIPFMDWSQGSGDYWQGFASELRVFRVDTATGITPLGAVSMSDMYQRANQNRWSGVWTPFVRRSVMADDYVYAISDAGVRAAKAQSLQTPVATTYFQPPAR